MIIFFFQEPSDTSSTSMSSRRGDDGGQGCQGACSKSWWMGVVKERVPMIHWLQGYNTNDFISDLIAGVTVGLTVMPQGLAYATLAGLEPQVSHPLERGSYQRTATTDS